MTAQKHSPWVGKENNCLHLVWLPYHFSSNSRREQKSLGEELDVPKNRKHCEKMAASYPQVCVLEQNKVLAVTEARKEGEYPGRSWARRR